MKLWVTILVIAAVGTAGSKFNSGRENKNTANSRGIKELFYITFDKKLKSSGHHRGSSLRSFFPTGNRDIITQPHTPPQQLVIENHPFRLVTNHENPTVFNFPSFTSTFSSGISLPLPQTNEVNSVALNEITTQSSHVEDDSSKSLTPFLGSSQVFENQHQGTESQSIESLTNLVRSQKISLPASETQLSDNITSNTLSSINVPPIKNLNELRNNHPLSGNGPGLQNLLPPTTPIPFSLESIFSPIPTTTLSPVSLNPSPSLFGSNLHPSFFSGGGFQSGGQFSPNPDTRQNEIFPFDPTFAGPPTPARYQPAIGGSCISFTGERGLCLSMSRCPSLRPLVKQLHNKELLTTLLNNVCRFENGAVYFCCEFPAFQGGEIEEADTREPAFIRSPHRAELPQRGECGRKSSRGKIIGGQEARPHQFPWVVAVGRPASDKSFLVDCGGVIITRRHVLTAAVCFLFPEFFQATHVRVAEHDTDAYDEVPHEDYVIVGRNDPGFLAPTTQNNLMILTIGRDFAYSDFVRPICLPPFGNDVPTVDTRVTSAGWGLRNQPGDFFSFVPGNDEEGEGGDEEGQEDSDEDTLPEPDTSNTLKYIEQRVLPTQYCQEAYSDPTRNFRVVDHRNICIRREGEDGVCLGDGGGPVMQRQNDDSYLLVGVISTTAGCIDEVLPTLATRVSTYMQWINYVIAGPDGR